MTADRSLIDVSFDVRRDSRGRDPDLASPTLRRYHQLLWSKPLPSGDSFDLDTTHSYLHHRSSRGEFWLSSDSVIATFTSWRRTESLTAQLSNAERSSFTDLGYTIGGMMVFPSQRVDNLPTINGARGLNQRIADRMDLTLECINRHYRGEWSPLGETLQRYADFFALFVDFKAYVDFFLLQDLVMPNGLGIKFFMPFDNSNHRQCRKMLRRTAIIVEQACDSFERATSGSTPYGARVVGAGRPCGPSGRQVVTNT